MLKLFKKICLLAGAGITGYAAYEFIKKKKRNLTNKTEKFEKNSLYAIKSSQEIKINFLDSAERKAGDICKVIEDLVANLLKQAGFDKTVKKVIIEKVKEALDGLELEYLISTRPNWKVKVELEKDFSKVFSTELFNYGLYDDCNGESIFINLKSPFPELGLETFGILNTLIKIEPEYEEEE